MVELKKRWELNGKLLENGDILCVEYELSEHLNSKRNFVFKDGILIRNDNFKLEVDSIFIDNIKLL